MSEKKFDFDDIKFFDWADVNFYLNRKQVSGVEARFEITANHVDFTAFLDSDSIIKLTREGVFEVSYKNAKFEFFFDKVSLIKLWTEKEGSVPLVLVRLEAIKSNGLMPSLNL